MVKSTCPTGSATSLIAINIESFVPIETFKKITGSIMREIRSTAKVPGQDRIFLAGEKEFDMMETRRKDGIPINKSLQGIMIELRKDLHLGDYDFPFFYHARAAL
jgi:L-2-hydroxycarboxylate dehydrogenase (NAD+)